MLKLVPMNDSEYDAFMQISTADHIRSRLEAGYWRSAEAEGNMAKLHAQILPRGFATPDHFFFNIVADENEPVGGLWYMVIEKDGQRMIFVMDIQVYPLYRRRGYGSQAFAQMEEQARQMGIAAIELNVFPQNHAARAMYEKLGYAGEGETMIKELHPLRSDLF